MTELDLVRLTGGGDPITQPLTMPAGWTPFLLPMLSATTLSDVLHRMILSPAA